MVIGALVAGGTLLGSGVAAAEPSPHCQQHGYCVFSATGFGGTKASVPTGGGCRATSELGIPVVRSAARGFGDGYALELYADQNCATSAGTVYFELPDTTATAYRLIPIPG
ncbi:hypothetical protein A4R43_13560 [Amycolatopsis albispora]|uniref:Peptidase inhibitor family I36 n=2 Tax=Amycolatopsis albispora TaxID=1804986 RepID=A0A344L5X4_9PSEU|nr:hypothetical protein A4R43_13560 [Amycolatopsis albispora]